MERPDSATRYLKADELRIERYHASSKQLWDNFIRESKNGTFLFCRDYMDHFDNTIQDCSLLIRSDDNAIVAVLPGYVDGDMYLSHGRLTYGGFITHSSTRLPLLLRVFEASLTWLRNAGIRQFVYKTIPHIYHAIPAEEDRYALSLIGAEWVRSGMLAVVHPARRVPYQERRRRAIKKALDRGLIVRRTDDYGTYWKILSEVLLERYATTPVHTLEQIQQLRHAFPANINLYACFNGPDMLAGVVVYRSPRVARTQYIASSPAGRAAGALDLLIDHLITVEGAAVDAVDLGTSDEQSGKILNLGLVDQKEGFGARCVALDQYKINVATWQSGTLTRVFA